jgi:hypothetical protein
LRFKRHGSGFAVDDERYGSGECGHVWAPVVD